MYFCSIIKKAFDIFKLHIYIFKLGMSNHKHQIMYRLKQATSQKLAICCNVALYLECTDSNFAPNLMAKNST